MQIGSISKVRLKPAKRSENERKAAMEQVGGNRRERITDEGKVQPEIVKSETIET
jgi:hypothetical protein